MEKMTRFIPLAAATLLAFAACEELPDYNTYIDAPGNLIYSKEAGMDNIAKTKVAHTPVGSFGSFSTVFPVQCNSGSHVATTVAVEFSEGAAAAYIADKALDASVLPAANLRVEKYIHGAEGDASPAAAVLSLPENGRYSTDSVKVSLVGDLSTLTERTYIAAVVLKSDAIGTSEKLGTYYLEVDTEINLIRPIAGVSDMIGFLPTDRSAWTAESDMGNVQNLFDGNGGTYATASSTETSLMVDMHATHLITGISLGGYYYAPAISSIEYSLDGSAWEQAGTPGYSVSGTVNGVDNSVVVAFYGYIEARFVKFNIKFGGSWYARASEFTVYEVEGKDPTLYIDAADGSGTILHAPGASSGSVDCTFQVKAAPQGTASLSGTVAVDNSLVAAYNEAKGTTYGEIPAANVAITGAGFSIAPGETASGDINVQLTGDLSGLRNATGYLIPIVVSSSSPVSATRNAYYIVVRTKEAVFKANPSLSDMGNQVTDKGGWSINWNSSKWSYGGSESDVIDGDYTTSHTLYDNSYSHTQFTVNMGTTQNVSGICLVVSNYSSWSPANDKDLSVEFSTDGTNWQAVADPSYDDNNLKCDETDGRFYVYCSLYDPKPAQYLKIKYGSYYLRVNELDVYTQ